MVEAFRSAYKGENPAAQHLNKGMFSESNHSMKKQEVISLFRAEVSLSDPSETAKSSNSISDLSVSVFYVPEGVGTLNCLVLS